MSVALDIIVVVILAGVIFNGFRKGLVKSALELVGGIVAIIIAFNFASPVGNFIAKNYIAPPIKNAFISEVAKSTSVNNTNDAVEKLEKIDLEKLLKDSPDFIKKMLASYGITPEKVLQDNSVSKAKLSLEDYKMQLIDSIINPIAKSVGTIIAFIVIFLIILILVKLLSFVFSFITKIPVINQFNKVGGLIFGVLNGLFILLILCSALKLVMPYMQKDDINSINVTTIEKTIVFKYIYHIDIFNLKINK